MILKRFKEIKSNNYKVKKGNENEKQTAYYLDFEFKDEDNVAVIHNLKLKYNGRTAQIDHIIIKPAVIYVIENKSFSGVLNLNNGIWTVTYQNQEISIPSPIEQNERHIKVLRDLLSNEDLLPRTLFGKAKIPEIVNIVMISTDTVLNKESKFPNNIIKTDSFKKFENKFKIDRLKSVYKIMSAVVLSDAETIEFAKNLIKFDIDKKESEKEISKKFKNENIAVNGEDQLIELLKKQRKDISKELKCSEMSGFTNTTIKSIAEALPDTKEEFLRIKGVGEATFNKYGEEALKLIKDFKTRSKIR